MLAFAGALGLAAHVAQPRAEFGDDVADAGEIQFGGFQPAQRCQHLAW